MSDTPEIEASLLTSAPPAWAVGFVYLFETDSEWQKIGFSQRPESRVQNFRNLPFLVSLTHCFPVGDAKIERVIHRSLRNCRVRGEWFCLSSDIIDEFKLIAECQTIRHLPVCFAPKPKRTRSKQQTRPGWVLLDPFTGQVVQTFGELLSQVRTTANLTRGELAQRSGVKLSTIAKLEAGAASWPRIDTVAKLEAAFGLEPGALYPRPDLPAAAETEGVTC